jgi:hypothetical protein
VPGSPSHWRLALLLNANYEDQRAERLYGTELRAFGAIESVSHVHRLVLSRAQVARVVQAILQERQFWSPLFEDPSYGLIRRNNESKFRANSVDGLVAAIINV